MKLSIPIAALLTALTISASGMVNVIFEPGLGDGPATWQKVAPAVSKFAHVVLYKRKDLQKNTTNKKLFTAQMAVNNLQRLLKKRQLRPPYLLVGHSLGGLYLQLFAREHPKEVSGMVLVDSTSPWQTINDPLPSKQSAYYREALGIPQSEKEVAAAPPFPNIPLIVLSATEHGSPHSRFNTPKMKALWAKWQAKLALLSNQTQHITANKTGHYIQKEKPWLVIAAIKALVNSTKAAK